MSHLKPYGWHSYELIRCTAKHPYSNSRPCLNELMRELNRLPIKVVSSLFRLQKNSLKTPQVVVLVQRTAPFRLMNKDQTSDNYKYQMECKQKVLSTKGDRMNNGT